MSECDLMLVLIIRATFLLLYLVPKYPYVETNKEEGSWNKKYWRRTYGAFQQYFIPALSVTPHDLFQTH